MSPSDAPVTARHQHPLAILRYTGRYLIFLLLPLIRGLRYAIAEKGVAAWLRGGWLDLAALSALVLLPLLRWARMTYRFTPDGFVLTGGLLWRHQTYLTKRAITTLSVEETPLYRLCGAVRLEADSDTLTGKRTDVSLILYRRDAEKILAARTGRDAPGKAVCGSWRAALALALFSADTLGGVLLLAAAFRRAGRLLGDAFRERLLGNLEEAVAAVTVLPRSVALLSLILLAGWLAGVIRTVVRFSPFSAIRTPRVLSLTGGLWTRRENICTVGAVDAVDERRGLLGEALGQRMLFFSCVGYGKRTMPVLIPAADKRQSTDLLTRLLPEFSSAPAQIRPVRGAVLWRLSAPLGIALGIGAAALWLDGRFPVWAPFVQLAAWVALPPLLWWLAVIFIDARTAGLAYANGCYTLRFSRRLPLHTVILPRHALLAVRLRRAPFARSNTCTAYFYPHGDRRICYRLRAMPADAIRTLTETERKSGNGNSTTG